MPLSNVALKYTVAATATATVKWELLTGHITTHGYIISRHLSRIASSSWRVMAHCVIFGFSQNMQNQQLFGRYGKEKGAQVAAMWSTSSSARCATMGAAGLHVCMSLTAVTWHPHGAYTGCLPQQGSNERGFLSLAQAAVPYYCALLSRAVAVFFSSLLSLFVVAFFRFAFCGLVGVGCASQTVALCCSTRLCHDQ